MEVWYDGFFLLRGLVHHLRSPSFHGHGVPTEEVSPDQAAVGHVPIKCYVAWLQILGARGTPNISGLVWLLL